MLSLLYAALASPLGIVITTDAPDRSKQQLYAARKKSGDVDLDKLSICTPPFSTNELWIVKNK